MLFNIVLFILLVLMLVLSYRWVKKEKGYEPKLAFIGAIIAMITALATWCTTDQGESAQIKIKGNSLLAFNSSSIDFDVDNKNALKQQVVNIDTRVVQGEFLLDSVKLRNFRLNKDNYLLNYGLEQRIDLKFYSFEPPVINLKNRTGKILITIEPVSIIIDPPFFFSEKKGGDIQKHAIGKIEAEIFYTETNLNEQRSSIVNIPINITYFK